MPWNKFTSRLTIVLNYNISVKGLRPAIITYPPRLIPPDFDGIRNLRLPLRPPAWRFFVGWVRNIKQKLHIVFDIHVNIVCNTYIASLNTKAAMTPIPPAEVRLDSPQVTIKMRLELIKRLTADLQDLLAEEYLQRNTQHDVQRQLTPYQDALGKIVYFLRSIHEVGGK